MSHNTDQKQVYLDKIDARLNKLNGQASHVSNKLRVHGRERFEASEFPTRKDEDYKYTSFKSLLNDSFDTVETVSSTEVITTPYLDAYNYVFIDGVLVIENTDDLPEGVFVGRLSEAWNIESLQDTLANLTSGVTESELNVFESLGLGLTVDPIFIHIPAGIVVDKPINLAYQASGAEGIASHPLHIVNAERSSTVQIIDSYVGSGSASYYTNTANRIFLSENAEVTHYRLQSESYSAFHTSNISVAQQRDSRYGIYIGEFGSKLMRNNVHIDHKGENITSNIYGLFISQDHQHIDTQSFIDHAQPNCESNELFKGILLDHGRGVFNGKIIVRPDAQKINAYQQNAALVLSPDAVMDSKPQLEIFADDVRCSHGATIGQLDPDSLFYLKTRGLKDVQAKALLKKAFLKDVIDQFPNETIASYFLETLEEELQMIANKSA